MKVRLHVNCHYIFNQVTRLIEVVVTRGLLDEIRIEVETLTPVRL